MPPPEFVQGADGFVHIPGENVEVTRPAWVRKIYQEAKDKVNNGSQRRLERLRLNRFRRSISQDPVEQTKRSVTTALASVGVQNVEGCLAWAFGPLFDQIPMARWWECWNGFHKDLFQIFPNDDMHKTFQRIGRAYVAFMMKYFKGDQFPKIPAPKGHENDLVEMIG